MKRKNHSRSLLAILLIFIFFAHAIPAGKVYLVIGSDTAIWSGMNTSRYNCTYDLSLYTDPLQNAYTVMDPAFRAGLVDSYGQPMKMTWWMMAGNIFRYATNNDIPLPNIMTLYLMKKYHGANVVANGDELSLHYHTFFWSDYDDDGIYYWNQSKTFLESLDDFKVTLAQFLLEEKVFPVSYRSGWHYMDNAWQNFLDERVLPYSMHNDYPAWRTTDPEPIDNIYDWSQAPASFVPYHPSKENYQVPGNSPGWQVRSASFQKTRANNYMDSIFASALQGADQVACLWAHLPESDFPQNMQIIDSLAHRAAGKYPGVKFQYCTAIEAMQLWRGDSDKEAPVLQFSDELVGDAVYFNIESNETVFQQQPFVAVKNIYNEYSVLECMPAGINQWKTITPVSYKTLAKAAVTVCDTMGNQAMEFLAYLPDEIFIDNLDGSYKEVLGNWSTSNKNAWGTDSRIVTLAENDSAIALWTYDVPQSTNYNIFIQVPDIDNQVDQIYFKILIDQEPLDTIKVAKQPPVKKWYYISTLQGRQGSRIQVEMSASGKNQIGKSLVADVLKISPLVRERDLNIEEGLIDFGQVSVEDSITYELEISNRGIAELHISSIKSRQNLVSVNSLVPISIPPMSRVAIMLSFSSMETGIFTDTLEILSDDPNKPDLKLQVKANVLQYFHTIDNEDSDQYQEFGSWNYSVANIYGPTSRYAPLNATPLASARFYTRLRKSGIYQIQEIVPKTVNSTDKAIYEVRIAGKPKASYIVDQNEGSGEWVNITEIYLPADTEIELWVKDSGSSNIGAVIRTDAVRFQLIEETTDITDSNSDKITNIFELGQNYPNPFNPSTKIEFLIPIAQFTTLKVYDILGKKVATLVSKKLDQGKHIYTLNGNDLASGIYYYELTAGEYREVRKMILLK